MPKGHININYYHILCMIRMANIIVEHAWKTQYNEEVKKVIA